MKGLADVIVASKEKLNKYADCNIPTKYITQLAEMLTREAVNETVLSFESFELARLRKEIAS